MNKKVMAMFEKAEDEYNALISKKNIIEVGYCCVFALFKDTKASLLRGISPQMDKKKIRKAIEDLDEKKRDTLKVTWEKVTRYVP